METFTVAVGDARTWDEGQGKRRIPSERDVPKRRLVTSSVEGYETTTGIQLVTNSRVVHRCR